MWRSSEQKLRRKFRRLARVSECVAQECNRLREANDAVRNYAILASIYGVMATIIAVAVLMGR